MEVVVLVGIPGSGKTTYVRARLPGHAYVSMDDVRDSASWPSKRRDLITRYDAERPVRLARMSGNKKAECILVDDALAAGRSIVVDDTNLTRKIRRPYVALARKHGARIRVVFFNDFEGARARNAKRAWSGGRVPDDAVARMQESVEPPTRAEGFDEVLPADGNYSIRDAIES